MTASTASFPQLTEPCGSCGRSWLASQLRNQRINRQWSQKSLAVRLRQSANSDERRHLPALHVIQRMIRSWEAGDTTPGEPYQRLYCRAFGMSHDDLFTVTVMEVLPGLDGPLLVAERPQVGTA
ncbi:helix-turn-helix transcriptional regulator [Spirillospora sp. NPDC047279]|uniref:helix-turn-helix domain-containing protein n=1 Tax=Spirillospora sp. NPDC047279 TaxID=3155478 RepID=UPI0033E6C30C